MMRTLFIALPLVLLAGCNSEPSGKSTTKLNAVEVQPGTISDSMIILDDATTDGTAIDNSVPDDGTKKDAAKPDDTGEKAEETAATSPEDTVIAPGGVSKKAPAEPATKSGE